MERAERIKLYGALFNKEAEANKVFEQIKVGARFSSAQPCLRHHAASGVGMCTSHQTPS